MIGEEVSDRLNCVLGVGRSSGKDAYLGEQVARIQTVLCHTVVSGLKSQVGVLLHRTSHLPRAQTFSICLRRRIDNSIAAIREREHGR